MTIQAKLLALGVVLLTLSIFSVTQAQTQPLNFQGRILVGGKSFNGAGQFKFALVDSTGGNTFWSNDGTSSGGSAPNSSVSLTLTNGLYAILLGDTSVSGMSQVVDPTIFTNNDVRLRVWFNDGTHGFEQLTPDQRLGAAGYALVAGKVASISAQDITGAISLAQLPAGVVTNGSVGVNINGTFSGDGMGMTNISLTGLDSRGGLTLASNAVPFLYSTTVPVGNGPVSVANLDVNGDGKADLVSANFADGTLTVMTNNGDGTFAFAATYPVGNGPSSIVVADVNGDFAPDLVVANEFDDTVSVLTNNGDGTFTTASTNMVGEYPYSAIVADVNGDGIPDVIAANSYFGDSTLSVLLGNGDGSYTEDAGSPYSVGAGPLPAAAADINNDGNMDLVSVNEYDNTLSVLTNNGDGTFTLSTNLPVGQEPFWVTAADINGDGRTDLVTANGFDHTLTVLTNDGSGNLVISASPAINVSADNQPVYVIATNLDNSGRLDLVSVNEGDNTLTVLTNNGDGTFGFLATLAVGAGPAVVTAVDVNGDNLLDLVTANYSDNTLTVLTNSPGGYAFTTHFAGDGAGLTGLNGSQITSGTISDSRLSSTLQALSGILQLVGYLPASVLDPDLALLSHDQTFTGANDFINPANSFTGTFTGSGAGVTNLNLMTADASGAISRLTNYLVTFTTTSTPNVGARPISITTADVNGDGRMDLIDANANGNSLTVLTNAGAGEFAAAGTYGVDQNPNSVAAADVNGDGKVDLISANVGATYLDGSLTVLTNDGNGGFVVANTYNLGHSPASVATADVNGDGKVDLISANNGNGTLTVLTNDGVGGFVASGTYGVGDLFSGLSFVAAADVNGDGNADLISVNGANNTLTVLTNDGSGGFAAAGVYGVGSQPKSVAVADVNGDNYPDLICNNVQDNTLMVLTNDGSGGFALAGTYDPGGGGYPYFVTAADMNGDGKVDLISANPGGNTLTVLTNDGSGGFTLAGTYPSGSAFGSSPLAVAVADLDGDGKLDMIGANYGDNTLTVLLNQATVGYTPVFTGNGAGLTGLNMSQIMGILALTQLPPVVLTNGASGVSINGAFTGDGTGITNIPVSAIAEVAVTNSMLFAWGDEVPTNLPASLNNVTAVAAGYTFSLALEGDGTVVAWGTDDYGQTEVPADLTDVTAISAGYQHALALKSDGTVVAWGDDGYGQAEVPADLTDVQAIAAGDYYSLALKNDGTVAAWGAAWAGGINVPADLTDVKAICAGGSEALALKNDGTVVAWGYAGNDVPAGLTDVVAVAAGVYHSLALKSDGTVVAWGENDRGQTNVPPDLTNVVAISAGYYHSLALKNDGSVVAWGDNRNSYGETNVPATLGHVIALASGPTFYTYNLVIRRQISAPFNDLLTGNGNFLTNLDATQLIGTIPSATLPAMVVTNTETGVTLSGTFSGDGSGLSNFDYNNITNPPVIPSTNGFVTAAVTNGLATTDYVVAATNGLATTTYVIAATNGLVTTAYVIAATNGLVKASVTNGLAAASSVAANFTANNNGLATNLNVNGLSLSAALNTLSQPIYLRGANDANHGVGYASSTTNFNGLGAPDGPMLWGYGGGALGSIDTGAKLKLVWTPAGVGIGTNSPKADLHVVGNVSISGNLTNAGSIIAGGDITASSGTITASSIRIGNNYGAVGVENVGVIRGNINSDGSIVRGVGFTATNTAAGKYTITFTAAFSDQPTVTASGAGITPMIPAIIPVSNSQVSIYFYNTSGTLANPSSFSFIAVGPP